MLDKQQFIADAEVCIYKMLRHKNRNGTGIYKTRPGTDVKNVAAGLAAYIGCFAGADGKPNLRLAAQAFDRPNQSVVLRQWMARIGELEAALQRGDGEESNDEKRKRKKQKSNAARSERRRIQAATEMKALQLLLAPQPPELAPGFAQEQRERLQNNAPPLLQLMNQLEAAPPSSLALPEPPPSSLALPEPSPSALALPDPSQRLPQWPPPPSEPPPPTVVTDAFRAALEDAGKSAPKFFEMRLKIMNEPASGPRTWRARASADGN